MFQALEFIKNQKNNDMLIINGKYTLSKDGKPNKDGSTRWKCTNRDSCTATVTLSADKNKILRESVHKCVTREDKTIIMQLLSDIKKEVCYNLNPIEQIFEGMLNEFVDRNSDLPAYNIPTYNSVKSSLYRARKLFLESDKLVFKKPEDFKVPKGLSKKMFILEDGNEEKIIVMCSLKMIEIIKSTGSISYYGDGTFRTCPKPFYQLYILHLDVYSDDKSINVYPVIYAFLPNKSQKTYTRLFELIKNKLQARILFFKCDYEIAQINAIRSTYEDIKVSGCYQHFNKAVWKKAKDYELAKKRSSNNLLYKSGRSIVRICSYFVLLPSTHMEQAWQAIINAAPDSPNMHRFLEYFENQWYNMDHNLISCANDVHRTTNSCEGYHRKLNSRLPKSPNIFLVFKSLLKEANYYDRKITRSLFFPFKKNRRAQDTLFPLGPEC